jgi:general secretion pathway protein E
VIAQRLVRRLCPECRKLVAAGSSVAALLGIEPDAIVYEPAGCPACNHSGFKGRIGVFEAVRIDETIRRLINDGADEGVIARHAFARADTLSAAARRLVRDGVTTPEEAVRISRAEMSDV